MANGLYKNIIQRLPAALLLVACISGILYLQNIYLILTIVIAVGFLLIKEWLLLSESNIDLKQIIFFVKCKFCYVWKIIFSQVIQLNIDSLY